MGTTTADDEDNDNVGSSPTVAAEATGPTVDRDPSTSSSAAPASSTAGATTTTAAARSSGGRGAGNRASMMMAGVKRRTPWKLIRKTASGIFSHLGLASLVFAYTVMGGFLFRYDHIETFSLLS